MQCIKCKKEFEPKEQEIIIKRNEKMIKCPFCKKLYTFIKRSLDYKKLNNGQLIRKSKKIRMSKKKRLKLKRG